MSKISDTIDRKFTEVLDASDWMIETDTGWEDLIDVKQTVPYEIWELELDQYSIKCADDHILFDEDMNEVFCKDLNVGDLVQTITGPRAVLSIKNTFKEDNMYDLGVNSDNHRYYSNDILSHNSTSAAGYLLWRAMFVPDSTILIAAHKHSGALEIMQRIRYAYEICPDFIRAGVTGYGKSHIEFENGSRLVAQATTDNTGRGMSISLLYLDEFAFVRPSIAREFWVSISPTLSTGGSAIITSTPNSDEDQFAEIWRLANKCFDENGNETELGVNGFKAFRAEWWEHPDRDEEWKQDEIGRIGEERFRREHGLEFIIDDETLIDSLYLTTLLGESPLFKQGTVRWYKNINKDAIYIIALDPSLGTGGDPAAIQVFEAPTMKQVAEWRHNKTRIPGQVKILASICEYIKEETGNHSNIYYSVENNTLGEAALQSIAEIGEEHIPGTFLSEPKRKGHVKSFRKGFNTTNKSKISACAKLKTLIETDKMEINSKMLISEFKNFVASGSSYKAKVGETDDLVMSTILAVRMAAELKNYVPELEQHMRDFSDESRPPMPFIMF